MSLLEGAPYLSEQTRQSARCLIEALKVKLHLYAASKQNFETAYQAAVHAYDDEIWRIRDSITTDFLNNMPDPYRIGDKLPAGDGSWHYLDETNVAKENETSKRSASSQYELWIPDLWEDDLRLLYVEAASKSGRTNA